MRTCVCAASYVLSTTTATTAAFASSDEGGAAGGDDVASSENSVVTQPDDGVDTVMENDFVKLTFSGSTGRLSSWVNKAASNLEVQVVQDYCYYESSSGDKHSTQPSGAYIFRPLNTVPESAQAPCHPIRHLFGDAKAATKITSVVRPPIFFFLLLLFVFLRGGSINLRGTFCCRF